MTPMDISVWLLLFATPERKVRNGSVRLPYTSHARHLKTAPFPGVILPSLSPESINVHFGSADFDTPPLLTQRQKPRLMFNAFRSKVEICFFSPGDTRGKRGRKKIK
ncbi:hypothetical protein CEXT_181811 [Caerostris extrusa]|uniref:Secreted protein n=1 Tax=Caerostris extrusa TaxID=172846 RepID=A0AAV4UUV2_CAEEX|nr:hypothetical protein CEXT_181811 [Caerostris extrusa]